MRNHGGFACVELLVVAALVALLASLHVGTRNRASSRARLVECLSHVRQLQHAALLYADDNDDVLPPNALAGTPAGAGWVPGTYMNWTTSQANTNVATLASTLFSQYHGRNSRLYKCPADTERAANGDRLRSFAMNSQMGHIETTIPGPFPATYTPPNFNPGWRVFKRTTDLLVHDPARLFVFIEEHLDSINDGHFQVSMSAQNFPSVPGSNHDGAGTLSFADGHVEVRAWETRPTVRKITLSNVAATTNDWRWLTERATRPVAP
jgi:prepilin-type processing-associated H-X9-DG protein